MRHISQGHNDMASEHMDETLMDRLRTMRSIFEREASRE